MACFDRQRNERKSKLRSSPRLFYLDEFYCLVAWAFNHGGAGVTEFVRLLEEFDALSLQLGGPGVEVVHAERNVIRQVAAGTDERLVSLTRVPVQRHIVEENPR